MSYDLKLSNGDLIIGSDNDVGLVTDQDKLKQDVVKIIITPKGSNVFHPGYGSLVNERLVGQPLTQANAISLFTASINEALTTLISLQKEQQRVQAISPAEQIVSVKSVVVERDKQEVRQINATITIITASGIPIQETMTMRLT